MYGNNQVFSYLSKIDAFLRSQQDQITTMKNELKELKEKINNLREAQTTNIDKIEYKFDQLKIETLEGTLNIGLAPNGMTDPETFQNFSVNQNTAGNLPILQNNPDLYPRIKENIQHYLMRDCPLMMNEIANKYNIPFDEQHKTFIIQDIERQLDGRIYHYLSKMPQENMRDHNNPEHIMQHIVTEIQKEVANTLDTFIKHMPKGGNF